MPRRGFRIIAAAASAALTVGAVNCASAITGSWSGAGPDNTWSTAANWDAVPGNTGGLGGNSSDSALFSGAPTFIAVAIDPGRNIRDITFDAPTSTSSMAIGTPTGNTLFLSNNGITEATATMPGKPAGGQNAVINAPMVLAGANYNFRSNFPNTASLSFFTNGPISAGTAAATTILLDGSNFDGANQGQSNSRLQSVISDGAAAGNGGLGITKSGPGTWELRPGGVNDASPAGTAFPTNSYTGPTTINQGILRISGPGGISPNSDLIVNPTGAVRFSVNSASANNPGLHPVVKRIIVNSNNNPAGLTMAAGSLNASNSSTQTIIAPPTGPAVTINFQNLVAISNLDGNPVFWLRGTVDRDGGFDYNAGPTTLTTIWGRSAAPVDLGTLNRPFDIARGSAANVLDLDIASPITGPGGVIKLGDGAMRIRGVLPTQGSPYTGQIEVQAGTLVVAGTGNSGVSPVLVNGGTLDIQGANQSFGAAVLTKGAFKSSTGVFQATGYTANVAGADIGTFNAILGDGTGGPSSLLKTGSGQARIHASATYTGTTTVNDGTLRVASDGAIGPASALVASGTGVLVFSERRPEAVKAPSVSVSGSGAIDLNDNDMVIASATPKSTVETYVRNARNGGLWNGSGLTSTTARLGPGNTNLGVLSGAEYDLFGPGGGVFSGQSYLTTDTLVKYTWNGDTNFSGTVNFDDYVRVDVGFNTNLTGWGNGDFNYSGAVNFDDYVLIDVAFNTQSGTLGRAVAYLDGTDRSESGLEAAGVAKVIGHFGQFGLPYASAFLAAVPEPASFGLIGIAAAAGSFAMARRRRNIPRNIHCRGR